jgi:hypothetical protein
MVYREPDPSAAEQDEAVLRREQDAFRRRLTERRWPRRRDVPGWVLFCGLIVVGGPAGCVGGCAYPRHATDMAAGFEWAFNVLLGGTLGVFAAVVAFFVLRRAPAHSAPSP